MNIIEGLNEKQKEALLNTEGATLVIAGAGSGKTKVLTHKIAYLIDEKGVAPWNILAITFTNKAANEMKERVENLIGLMSNDVWIGTFHAICLRILRKHIEKLGYNSSFSIYDVSEQKTAIKQILKDLDIDSKIITDKYVQAKISNFKNDMKNPEDITVSELDFNMTTVLKIYQFYQKRLKENNAIDFDDIINLTIKLLDENPDVLEEYSEKFRYVLVDEYQDTNKSQFKLVKLFTSKYGNITVVGDNDQGIYSFRGADIQNILDFEKDYKDAKVIKLEQNYRSTKNILDVANAVIKNNESKYDKKLWTESEKGEIVKVNKLHNEYMEARFIADSILTSMRENGYKYSDFAVLYRMNTLSRVIEEIFVQEGIPYKMVGGLKFWDRKEIKDIISYLRLIENPADNIAFSRIINEPKRGIGNTTLDKISRLSMETGLSMYDITKRANEFGMNKLYVLAYDLISTLEMYRNNKNDMSLSRIYKGVLEDTKYMEVLREKAETDDISKNRIENLEELYNSIIEFEKEEADASLQAYLENQVLSSDLETGEETDDTVTLMTLHASKGLEFPSVFLIGLEEGIFPSSKAMLDHKELAEERRLCYVGITRAKEKLNITLSGRRTVYGKSTPSIASRFIKEIPDELAEKNIEELRRETSSYEGKSISFDEFGNSKINYINSDQKFENKFVSADKFLESLKQKKNNGQKYEIGQKVLHKKFGKGDIINIIPESEDRIIEIKFEKVGLKRLMENFIKLEIIE